MDGPVRQPGRGGDDGGEARGVADLADRDRRSTADEEVMRGDNTMERAADRLRAFSARAAASSGLKAKLAQPLAEDAEFLRKLKPSLIVARAKGQAPTDQEPGEITVVPTGPQLGERRRPGRGTTQNPWVVIGVALAAGVVLAKALDWRSHAHPRQ